MEDKRDECGCHRDCTTLEHSCEKPCKWPSCLSDAETETLLREIGLWDPETCMTPEETAMTNEASSHIGRSWSGPGHLEESCPCPKAPCGLVSRDNTDPDCLQHPGGRCKTMRVGHLAQHCKGPTHFQETE